MRRRAACPPGPSRAQRRPRCRGARAFPLTGRCRKCLETGRCPKFDDAQEAAAFADQYQNTYFTINEYFSIGQVANLVNFNGGNAIHVTLEDGAVWQVTGASLISSLTIGEGCRVIVPAGVTLTVNGTAYTDCTLTETK